MYIDSNVARYVEASSEILLQSLGKNKNNLISKGFSFMDGKGYSYGCVLLTSTLLDEFIPLYEKCIRDKINPKIADLSSIYSSRLGNDDIFFSYIRDINGYLVAGSILILKTIIGRKTLIAGFKVCIDQLVHKLSLGDYLEYIFFDCGLSLGVEQYCYGTDRNGYGYLGASIGLAFYKMKLGFYPFVSSKSIPVQVDQTAIDKSCLFFTDPDSIGRYTSVSLFFLSSEQEKYKDFLLMCEKRGFFVDLCEIL